MRPKKTRWVKCDPGERHFKPNGKTSARGSPVVLTLDEFEALRLLDLERLSQTAAAKAMKVHRSTVSRIVASAHKKVAQALVEIVPLRIEGGCCRIVKKG